MKKYMLICLLLVLILVCIGCSLANPASSEPSETEPQESEPIISTEPDDGEELGVGGTGRMSLECKYDFGFYGTVPYVTEFIGNDVYWEWYKEGYYGNDSIENYTILDVIEKFNISKEDLMRLSKENSVYGMFRDEEFDVLYSGDKKLIAETFMNPNAILVGDEIYPPKWVATHTAEEIAEAGITLEVLSEKCVEWTETFGELSEIHAQTQARLAEYKAYVENKQ
ncbi:MAG: hypothetical protein HFE78_08665 [Clostridiales bacterium]|nr:hypothetical protein [Clostridiales bacterium]